MTGRVPLFLIAIFLGSAFYLGIEIAMGIASGKEPYFPEYYSPVSHAVLTMPFLPMAFFGNKQLKLWIIAGVINLSLLAFAARSVWVAAQNNFAGGADIGLGLVLLFAPVITMMALIVAIMGGKRLVNAFKEDLP